MDSFETLAKFANTIDAGQIVNNLLAVDTPFGTPMVGAHNVDHNTMCDEAQASDIPLFEQCDP